MTYFGTDSNGAFYGELPLVQVQSVTVAPNGDVIPGPLVSVAPRPGTPGTLVKVRDAVTDADLPDTNLDAQGFLSGYTAEGVLAFKFSTDGGTTWLGPYMARETVLAAAQAGDRAAQALTLAQAANTTAALALTTAQSGPAATWGNIADKPLNFPPTDHTHPASQLSDASTVGKAVLTAADAQAARAAIGAGTGNGTSNLTLGSTSTTAAPGNHVHAAAAISFTPTATNTATNMQDAVVNAGNMGGGSGGGSGSPILLVNYASGAYPTLPTTKPAGVSWVIFRGPVWPPSVPAWIADGSVPANLVNAA